MQEITWQFWRVAGHGLDAGVGRAVRKTINWILRNLADHLCDMLRVGVLFSFLRYLEMIFLLYLLLLTLSLQALGAVVKHAKFEQIEFSLTIHTSFNEL